MIHETYTLKDLHSLAQKILISCSDSKVFAFNGNLGAGKTTLVKALCAEAGYSGEVTSPTFSIINEYPSAQFSIYHMDLYRLKAVEEALEIGIEDYLYSDCYCFIEWPELVKKIYDGVFYEVNISTLSNDERKIEVLKKVNTL